MNINRNYLNLQDSYLFARIAKSVNEFKAQNPDKKVISLGIGDVTLPLSKSVIAALSAATLEMGNAETFKGYGDYEGYAFLRKAFCDYYAGKGLTLELDEIFVSDGAKSDVGNMLDIFSEDNTVLIPDPVYPVYVDTNIMAGRNIVYMDANDGNSFKPLPDKNVKADIIYLCSPNNPTGAVYNKAELALWVEYALENDAVILFDSAYEAFVCDKSLPTSIYQIDRAEQCAIEFCSLSKTAGFTGTRCGFTIIPKALTRSGESLNRLWLRRQSTKFNGVPYIIQRGAEAVFSPEGLAEARASVAYYMDNARVIADTLTKLGIEFTGGHNAPYVWLKCPDGLSSWEFFDKLLTKMNIVGTPGAGFGKNGEGNFRLSAFGNRDNVAEAMKRLEENL
ncbi:MAG: LL-diaminopimelate aminotransferase [Oscillospiraceae bacterium]|nr:LL-diaminopimelate aminotransferase [Oscillospiraceae bacterium]MCL2279045.1 LL-diaminopimelate aminotransferase [Oscillospiraceae bacterium]